MLSWLHASPHRCCLFFEKALLLSFPKAIVISHSVLAGCMEKREGPKSQRSCDKKCLSVLSNPPLCNVCLHKPPVHSNNTTIFFFFFFYHTSQSMDFCLQARTCIWTRLIFLPVFLQGLQSWRRFWKESNVFLINRSKATNETRKVIYLKK